MGQFRRWPRCDGHAGQDNGVITAARATDADVAKGPGSSPAASASASAKLKREDLVVLYAGRNISASLTSRASCSCRRCACATIFIVLQSSSPAKPHRTVRTKDQCATFAIGVIQDLVQQSIIERSLSTASSHLSKGDPVLHRGRTERPVTQRDR